MNSTIRRLLIILNLLICTLATPAAMALKIDDIVNPTGVTSVVLSPDGKHVALIGYTGLNHSLIMFDADTHTSRIIITSKRVTELNWKFYKEPRAVTWVTNDLLAVDYGVEAESVTIDGKKVADIGAEVIGKVDPDQPDSPMLLAFTDWDQEHVALINARTGDSTKYRYPMSGTPTHWVFDKHGVLRAMTLRNSAFWKDATTRTNWYRSGEHAEWEKMAEFKVTDNFWIPLAIPEKADSLVVLSSIGRDTKAVFYFNTRTHEIGEMMAGHPTQDILRVDGIDLTEFKSVVTNGMRQERYWFDQAWDQLQSSVDAALPKRVNRLSGDPKNRVLIFSYGDVDPGRWFLLDVAGMTMRELAEVKPSVDVKQMSPMEVISYPSLDGLSIPAYLTRPAGPKQPVPTVVMIHGGPTVRDTWRWDPDVQLLAANGYAVFQPQFRGSSGFGRKFEEAGYGQWGLAMQDDITAGVQYLIRQGIADPKRICIFGASYGGYAALWGLVKTPELYRCGVSFAGVADIEYMFNDSSDSNHDKATREVMRFRIGDINQDKEHFDLVSPLKHADRIQAPLLLMHGEEDKRVPISHSEKMKKELDRNHKVYEWLTFEDEGHGLTYVRNQSTFYKKLLEFLNKYIGPVEKASEAQAATTISDPQN